MKNNQLIIISVVSLVFLVSLKCTSDNSQNAKLETKSDWITLLNRNTSDNWQSTSTNDFPKEGWKFDGNTLTVKAKTDSTPGGKDIISKNQYSNFELDLEVKLTPGANSGIKYFVSNEFPDYEGQYLGLEYQLIDDEIHPDASLGNNNNRTMASLYDLIPPLKDKIVYPPGEWNKVKIIVNGNHVEHWLNEIKLLEFDRKSDAFKQLVNLSKYKIFENFGDTPKGHILLQGHNDEVSFREIKIRTW